MKWRTLRIHEAHPHAFAVPLLTGIKVLVEASAEVTRVEERDAEITDLTYNKLFITTDGVTFFELKNESFGGAHKAAWAYIDMYIESMVYKKAREADDAKWIYHQNDETEDKRDDQ